MMVLIFMDLLFESAVRIIMTPDEFSVFTESDDQKVAAIRTAVGPYDRMHVVDRISAIREIRTTIEFGILCAGGPQSQLA